MIEASPRGQTQKIQVSPSRATAHNLLPALLTPPEQYGHAYALETRVSRSFVCDRRLC